MDREYDYTPPGFCRPQRNFLRDFHRRAFWVGVIQLMLASFYMYLAICEIVWNLTRSENYWSRTKYYELWFWLILRDLEAILHVISSLLIIKVSSQSPEKKLKGIRYCSWSKIMNQVFFLYEIIVLVFIYWYWQLGIFLVLFRLWFNHEVNGLLKTVRILSPPPPGYHC